MMVPEGPESCNPDDLQVDDNSRPEGRAETPAAPRSLPDLLGMPVSEPMIAPRADSDDDNNHDGVSITAGNQKVIADDPPATADERPAERAETAGPKPSLPGLLGLPGGHGLPANVQMGTTRDDGNDDDDVDDCAASIADDDEVDDCAAIIVDADQKLIANALESPFHAKLFENLWKGDIRDFDDAAKAAQELCYILALETRNDPERIDRLFRLSGFAKLHDTQWDIEFPDADGLGPNTNGQGWVHQAINRNQMIRPLEYTAVAWDDPIPLSETPQVPTFPVECLPAWLRQWVEACSVSLQAPPDLFAMLALPIAGAGLARQFVAVPREDWCEPINL